MRLHPGAGSVHFRRTIAGRRAAGLDVREIHSQTNAWAFSGFGLAPMFDRAIVGLRIATRCGA
jgi:hypothetical protein